MGTELLSDVNRVLLIGQSARRGKCLNECERTGEHPGGGKLKFHFTYIRCGVVKDEPHERKNAYA